MVQVFYFSTIFAKDIMRNTLFLFLSIFVITAGLAACQTVETTRPGAVKVKRDQRVLSFVSEEQMQESAAQAYAKEIQKAEKQNALNEDKELVKRVRSITSRLIEQTGTFRKDARGWPWEINVQSSPQINAYAMPGGKIMVYSGLAKKLDLSDAELAAVIGHEIAHALREHARERVSRAYGQQLLLAAGGAVVGASENAVNLANAVGQVTFQLPHSRDQETEADQIGLELMARAGYDPHAAISVWENMMNASDGRPPQFLSTHPKEESRIRDLKKKMPRVMPLYQASR
jgi:predicted Zn-dependent protease